MFELDATLARDSLVLGSFPLCLLLSSRDGNYPWFILVPRRASIREVFELSALDQQQLLRESVTLSRALQQAYGGDKLNVAALGNMVPQLHVHHIVRYREDPAWPKPVWGAVPAREVAEDVLWARAEALLKCLSADFERA
ncbi:MAG: HIT domain-containing protein [Porticoccaceae bacterium]